MKNNIFVLAIFLSILVLSLQAFAADKEIRGLHKENGITCADCHKTDSPTGPARQTACKECHTDKINDTTMNTIHDVSGREVKTSIHNPHVGQLRCTLCHKVHEPSVLYCNDTCHTFTAKVP